MVSESRSPSPEPADLPGEAAPADARYERFVLLFVRAEPALHSYLLSLLSHWDDADEVLQQVSLVLWRKFDQFELGSDFRLWACQVARFEALNYRRKGRRDRHVFQDELTQLIAQEALDDLDRFEAERRALADCLPGLKTPDRLLIERCYSQEVPIKQLAAEHDCTPNSLYKRLNRLRTRLQQCIRKRIALEESP